MTPENSPKSNPLKIDFKIKRVRTDCSQYAAACFRAAVLYPLYPPTAVQHEQAGYVASKTLSLIELRRRRLQELHDIFPEMFSQKSHAWYANCPPFGVYTNRRTRVCRLTHFCPFCWSREVIVPVLSAVLALFPESEQNPKLLQYSEPESGASLWLYISCKELPVGEDLGSLLRQEKSCLQLRRLPLTVKSRHHLGSLVWSTVFPNKENPGGWQIVRRRLTVVAPGGEVLSTTCDPSFVNFPPESVRAVRTGDVIATVARTLRYPGWLLQDDPRRVAEWLRSRQGLRLLVKSGKLRRSLG